MKIGLFWTDECFFLVLFIITIIVLNGLRNQQNRLAFARIFSKPIPVCSAIILLFFLTIGILDSIHFKPNSKSVLDNMLSPIGNVYEKTYSKPLSLHLFTSEVYVKNGKTELIYPRLKYISSTIQNKLERSQFIHAMLLKALVSSLLITAISAILLFSMFRKQFFSLKKMMFSVLGTLFFCLLIVFASYYISRGLHVLGTGKIGQDVFYSTIKSIRTGLLIGILTTLFMMPLALLLGIMAGYFGGIVDDIIQYIYTTLSSIPGVLLISASVLSLQTYIANHPNQFSTLEEVADARLLSLCLILGITSWTSLCRLLRAETLMLKEIDYVTAAKALGTGAFKIIYKHLLPNVMHIVIITFVLDFSFLVLAEAVLSYVGVGVSPLTISWGNMINAARLELARDPVVWWPMFAAFIFMFTLVLSSNLFADAVEDAFNPRNQE